MKSVKPIRYMHDVEVVFWEFNADFVGNCNLCYAEDVPAI